MGSRNEHGRSRFNVVEKKIWIGKAYDWAFSAPSDADPVEACRKSCMQ